jgi:predicted HicB family RNase H-like nuclease
MSKKVAFSKKPSIGLTDVNLAEIDDWVENRNKPSVKTISKAKLKRFTFDISEELHKKIKARCASEGISMGDRLNRILEREFS